MTEDPWDDWVLPPSSVPDPFPVTNRATRRHCEHQWKTIGERTACADCGKDKP